MTTLSTTTVLLLIILFGWQIDRAQTRVVDPSESRLKAELQTRPRTRDLGLKIGILQTGPNNSITDVSGVLVGHTTVIRGDNIRTGVTAILPHNVNLFREKVPGAVF